VLADAELGRDEQASIEFTAVDPEEVYFVDAVSASDVPPGWRSGTASGVNTDHVSRRAHPSPLALDAEEPLS
jgi:hypothetical protein